MNLKTKAGAYGIGGLAVAGLVIFSGVALGVIDRSPFGVLSILMTDPPSVPDGVSAVFIHYSNFALHATGFGESGWIATQGQGTLETLALVNLSQTISSSSIPSLRYNLIAFNVSSTAGVEFQGRNYSATVNGGRLVVPIDGGLTVNSSHPAAAMVDIHPTILNLGNQTSPEFVITTSAKALQVPSNQVTDPVKRLGYKLYLAEQRWFQNFVSNQTVGLSIGEVALTSNSLAFSVTNHDSDPVSVRMVIVTLYSPMTRPTSILSSLANSAVFIVEQSGDLIPLKVTATAQAQPVVDAAGYVIQGGSSSDFNFSGAVRTLNLRGGVSSGATYYIIIVGAHTLSFRAVQAA